MGINADDWLQLWNGVAGALVSALLAAGVAILVVWLTNKHQGKQAALARSDAYVQSEKALREQKLGLEMQLRVQVEESRRAETLRYVADFVSAVEALFLPPHGSDEDTEKVFLWTYDLHIRMSSASQGLKMTGEYAKDAHKLLGQWPTILTGLALAKNSAETRGKPTDELENALDSACKEIILSVPRWFTETEVQRAETARTLRLAYKTAVAVQDRHEN